MLVQKIAPWVAECTLPEWVHVAHGGLLENFLALLGQFVISEGGSVLAMGALEDGGTGEISRIIIAFDANPKLGDTICRRLARLVPSQPPPDDSVSEANSSSDPEVPLP